LVLIGCGGPSSNDAAAERERGPILLDATMEAGLAGYRHVHGGIGQKWMPEIVGPGCAFLDYDGDGWQDILLVGGGAWPETPERPAALWLYRNRGDGTFELVTEEAGLGRLEVYPFGVAAADYDNDGDTDVFVTTLHENLLLRNDGGTFVEVSREAGLADEALWSTSALFFDADRDGWLDLFVANYVSWTPETDVYCGHEGEKGYCTPQLYDGVPSTYYRNNGDGTFTNRTEEAGFAGAIEPGQDKALGVVELDFDQDGWPDLFVANDTERDLLFRNEGDGTFAEEGIRRGVSFDQHGRPRAGMGVDAGVVDTSGRVSIFVGNFSQEMVGVYTNTPSGHFTDRATISKIGHASLLTLTFGLFLADLDLDTDLDLFLANGHVQEHISEIVEGVTFAQPAQLFLNEGNGSYTEVSAGDAAPATPLVGRGAAYGDYDRDGDVDVLIVENDGTAHLWRNDTRAHTSEGAVRGPGFLRVSVEGNSVSVNRDGIGTVLVAVMDSVHMERRIRSGSSYLSESERVATFGLGEAEVVDTLIVTWPDGEVDRFEQVGGNRHVHIRQGGGRLEPFASWYDTE
jgi:predicted nucleotidyltransferase